MNEIKSTHGNQTLTFGMGHNPCKNRHMNAVYKMNLCLSVYKFHLS